MVDIVNATGNSNLSYRTIPGRYSLFSAFYLDPTMDPSDPGAKLPEGSHDKPEDTNGRKEHSPPVPPEPSGSSPTLGTVTKREPFGKGGKGKSSTPKKRSSSQSSIIIKESGSLALQKERSSSVKDPTQSSILRKDTVPIAPQVIRRSKSIRRIKGDPLGDYLTPSIPVGIGFDSPPRLNLCWLIPPRL